MKSAPHLALFPRSVLFVMALVVRHVNGWWYFLELRCAMVE